MFFATIDLPRGRKHKNPSAFTNCDYKKWLLLICDHCKKTFLCKHCLKTKLNHKKHYCTKSCMYAEPKIHNTRRISLDEVKKRIKQIHGDLVTIVESTYVKASQKAKFIDKDYGEWSTLPKLVMSGRRHTAHKCVNFKKSRTLTIQVVIDRLQDIHNNNVTLKKGQTYVHSHTKMTFLDKEYGEWDAWPTTVLQGHGHPIRGQRNSHKNAKHTCIIKHWLTNSELTCTGSYEKAFVEWCNQNEIDFDWQIPIETPILTPGGKNSIYFIDAYIKSGQYSDTWIELKGTFNRNNGHIGKEKWEWFHSTRPNSQLWTSEKLLQLKIIK